MRSSTRNSNLELLKIIAILFIIISHTMPFYYIPKDIMGHIDINIVTRDIQTLILINSEENISVEDIAENMTMLGI